MTASRTLVAGIGNIFLGDDGFGSEVVRRLAERPLRHDVAVVDFGIRGVDLAYALVEHQRVILVDATPRGRAPGTLYVIDPELPTSAPPGPRAVEGHSLDPQQALAMAQAMGGSFTFLRVVGCEPAQIPEGDDVAVGLSPAVAAAVEGAVALVEELLGGAHA